MTLLEKCGKRRFSLFLFVESKLVVNTVEMLAYSLTHFVWPVLILTLNIFQESPQAARVKVMASGNSVERRFRLHYYTCLPLLYLPFLMWLVDNYCFFCN